MVSLHLEIPGAPPLPNPLGLLLPIPPDTAHQKPAGERVPKAASLERCRALNAEQNAYFLPALDAAGSRFEFDFASGTGASPGSHFEPLLGRYSRPSSELCEAVLDLVSDAPDDDERVTRVVHFTASLFDYDHPPVRFHDGKEEVPMLFALTKGSCTDINTFLLSALYALRIPVTYYAGYFFESGHPSSTSGFHCWISTRAAGRHLDWDIAHHIKNGIRAISPSLNPIPGKRIAMSRARGLRFRACDVEVEFAHFAYPMWIYADGSYEPAGAVATLIA